MSALDSEEEDNIRRLTGHDRVSEDDDPDSFGWHISDDPLLRTWDTAQDAMAEMPGEWWEEEPGFWMCECPAVTS